MSSLVRGLRSWMAPVARRLRRLARRGRYELRRAAGGDAGDYTYVFDDAQPPGPAIVELLLPAWGPRATHPRDAAAWCRRQTLPELRAAGFDRAGREVWRVDRGGPVESSGATPGAWFFAPSRLPDLDPAHLESCLLVIAAERLDAVALEASTLPFPTDFTAEAVTGADPRRVTVFDRAAYRYDAATDAVRPRGAGARLVKRITAGDPPAGHRAYGPLRRGPYHSSAPLRPLLEVRVRDAAGLRRRRRETAKTPLLITTSFLARGGAEHTLFETLKHLRDRFDLTIVTLAPHRPELGDRRDDFRQITPRIFSLGDLVHPAAMPGILIALLDSTGAEILYNANGTTLFYEFAPRLKAARDRLRIVDHLYDHRIGYIDRYRDDQRQAIDACVAENHRIAEVLTGELGWPTERVPVIWPCARPADAFADDPAAVRRAIRRDLGYGEEDLVILTAARMHPQKRPLDLVALAAKVADLEGVHFLLVGGGELETEVDRAIRRAAGARIRRLPFRADIPDLIVAADAGCLVSDYEGLPVFMLECLQAGRPFLGTDVGEMGRVLRQTGAGLVVERPGDLEALERAVRQLADRQVRQGLARRARRAGSQFDVETCAERYAAAFLGPTAGARTLTPSPSPVAPEARQAPARGEQEAETR